MKTFFLAGALACTLGAAHAATVVIPFDGTAGAGAGYWGGAGIPETEMGFQYYNESTYRSGAYLYLHDDGGGRTTTSVTPIDGGRFDVVGADIRGYTNVYHVDAEGYPTEPLVYDNFGWFGYRAGQQVASWIGHAPEAWTTPWAALNFGDVFRDLDRLEIRYLAPSPISRSDCVNDPGSPAAPETLVNGAACFDTWTGGIQVDNLALRVEPAPIPLPAGLPLLAGALALLGVWRRRAH